MATSASRAATNVHHFALELGIAFKVLLVAPGVVLVEVIIALFRIALNHLALVFGKRTRQRLVLALVMILALVIGVSLIIGHVLCL